MFPIPADRALLIRQIADYWSREIHPRASAEELCQEMLQGFWRGELRSISTTRLTQLQWLYESGPTDRIVLSPVDNEGFPMSLTNEDLRDIPVHISVPNDSPDSWTEEDCSPTFRFLSEFWGESTFPGGTAVLASISVTADQFFAWVDSRKFDRPTFWTPPRSVNAPSDDRHPVNEATARKLFQDYKTYCDSKASKPSQQEFEKFVLQKGFSGGREHLRKIFKEKQQAAGKEVKRGRPPNSPAEK
jgi:hypothetical protein